MTVTKNASPIPILVYHQIAVAPEKGSPSGSAFRSLYVAPSAFARQMLLLKILGYQGLSMTALEPYLRGERHGKVVGITFDDGYLNNLTDALPVLQRHGFSSTCYAVSSQAGQTNIWDLKTGIAQTALMDAGQMRQWVAAGQEIGSHTRSHVHLTALDDAASSAEIALGRSDLETMLQTSVTQFCYPYGEYKNTHLEMARQHGFSASTTTARSRCHAGADLLALPRVSIVRSTTLAHFLLKLLTSYEDGR